MERRVRSFENLDALPEELGIRTAPPEVKKAEIHEVASLKTTPESQYGVIVTLSTGTNPPLATLWDRRQLLEFARQILREYDPTPQDKILDSLNRIEALLRAPGDAALNQINAVLKERR